MNQQYSLKTFYIIMVTQVISLIGSSMTGFAIGIWLYAQTGDVTPLGLVSFFQILPMVLLSNIAGLAADRFDRRWLMMVSDIGQAVGTILLLASFLSGAFQVWHLYVVTVIQAATKAFQSPAFMASVTMLVPDKQREQANAMIQLSGPLSNLIAPALTGVLYGIISVTGVVAIDLTTALIAVTIVALTKIPQPVRSGQDKAQGGSMLRELSAGFTYLWKYKPFLVLMLFAALLNFLLTGMSVLTTPYVLSRTGNDVTVLGIILSVMNAGMIVGGILIGVWGGTRPRIHTVMVSLLVLGVGVAVFGMARSPYVLAGAMFITMMTPALANVPLMSMMQAKIPPDMQGRVFATIQQVAMIVSPLGVLLVGPLADNVFEPLVGQPAWAAFAPFFGDSVGAGMGLMTTFAGVGVFIASAIAYALPMIRHMEENIPDYVPEASEEPATIEAAQDTSNTGLAVAPAAD